MVTLKKREGIALFSRNIEGTPTPNAATRRASTKNSAPQAARYSSHFGRPRQRNSTSRRCTNAATNSEISPPRRLGERRFRKPSQIPQPNVAGKPEVEVAAESCPSRRGFYPQMPGGIRRSASGSICRRLAPRARRGLAGGCTWRATTNASRLRLRDWVWRPVGSHMERGQGMRIGGALLGASRFPTASRYPLPYTHLTVTLSACDIVNTAHAREYPG